MRFFRAPLINAASAIYHSLVFVFALLLLIEEQFIGVFNGLGWTRCDLWAVRNAHSSRFLCEINQNIFMLFGNGKMPLWFLKKTFEFTRRTRMSDTVPMITWYISNVLISNKNESAKEEALPLSHLLLCVYVVICSPFSLNVPFARFSMMFSFTWIKCGNLSSTASCFNSPLRENRTTPAMKTVAMAFWVSI